LGVKSEMKVLVVGHSMTGGGAEFVMKEWIKYLLGRGDSVDVALLHGAPSQQEGMEESRFFYFSEESSKSHIAYVRELRKVVQQGGYDACLAMQTYPALILLLATWGLRTRPRVVISERNMPSLLLPTEGLLKKAQLVLARRIYRRADAVIAIAHPVAADLIASFHIKPEKCFVVPNPATAKVGIHNTIQPSAADSVPTIVLPFRLVPQKRPTLALRVAAELRNRGLAVRVLSFGQGPLEGEFRALADDLDIDHELAGWRERWFENCPAGSVVLLPSYCEGFGNVLIEAAAAGIPSVAWSGALGVADAIIPGATGFFASAQTPASYADAVEYCLDMKVEVPSGWLSYFSIESSGKRMREVLAG
jgi:glycosyltransferase involved in cell wall biosynthesis